jgi:hypothetical protein
MAAQNNPFRRSWDTTRHAFKPGHLFWMPAGATWLNLDKPRPFALAAQSGEAATLIYGSTQETEKSAGAACVEVAPVRDGLNRNALRTRTCFYPGTLLPVLLQRLPAPSGFLGRSLHELRVALRFALGIGRGSCLGPYAPAGSCRGRLIYLSAALARGLGASAAIVLTEPAYSAQRNYQIILPVFTAFNREIDRFDLLISARDRLQGFPGVADRVLLPIPITQSVWHEDDIEGETEYVLDDGSLAEIDRRLCDYFSLAPPNPDEGG